MTRIDTGKADRYAEVKSRLAALLSHGDDADLDDIARMASVATCLKMAFPHLTFAGFYRVVPGERLLIGPYQGDVYACTTIAFGRGVCGAGAARRETVIVPDVTQFPGYIACDDETKSEIVVPVVRGAELIAVLDLDSDQVAAFDEVDRECLEALMAECFGHA